MNIELAIAMTSSQIGNGNMVKITPDPLSLQEVTEFVTDPSTGGISIFMGEVNYEILFELYIEHMHKLIRVEKDTI